MMHKSFYIKNQYDKYNELSETIINRAKSLYGSDLPEIIASRIDWELSSIKNTNDSYKYLIAKEIVADSKQHGCLTWVRGAWGSSFVAFLLDITDVNPLTPHFLCSECKHIEFNTSNNKCPKCGSIMKQDGYNIPAEMLYGYNKDKSIPLELDFASEHYDSAINKLIDLAGEANINTEEKEDCIKIKLLSSKMLSALKKLEEIGVKFSDIPLNDSKAMKIFKKCSKDGIEYFSSKITKEVLQKTEPKNIDELARVLGICSIEVTNSNITEYELWEINKTLIEKGVKLTDVISFRDDIMLYLISVGIDRDKAYEICYSVTYGKGLKDDDCALLKSKNVHEWYIDVCSKVSYLFSKSHCISLAKIHYYFAYYKAQQEKRS